MGGLTAATEQQYSLRWNDFHASILSSFRHLRDEEDFVDVTLACDGRSFTAHKVVLSACSPYFRRLLKANPCNHPIIILRDVHEKDMEALLRFMYNGEVHVGHEQLPDFLKTAQTLQVRGLADVPNKENRVPAMLNDAPWPTPGEELPSRESAAEGSLSPPPSKRSRTNEERHTPQHDRDSSRDHRERDRERERETDRRDQDRERDQDRDCSPAARRTPHHLLNNSVGPEHHSLLGQALEGGPQMKSAESAHVSSQSTGEDDEESNSGSDTGISERGISGLTDMVRPKSEPSDYSMEDNNGHGPGNGALGMDSHRSPNFPAALLGLQAGLPGLLPGPSGLHGSQENTFVNRRSLDMMRVRATDPRPCPKCGKIYRSAHTLRTHLEDKHTVCPGYRCVLCGTVAKSRNSLHSHMSRQHRGISTKDLPVLPMPSPFDPELASRLLAKAGVKVTAAELRARSSPTGPPRRSDMRLDLKQMENNMNNMRFPGAPSETGSSIGRGDDMDDPEDLTVPTHRFGGVDITAVSPPLNNINSHHLDRERDRDRDRDRDRGGGGGGQATITKIGPPSSPRHHPPPGSNMSHHQMHGAVLAAKSLDSIRNRGGVQDAPTGPPGPPGLMGSSAILDAYLQMIAESQGLNMNSEQAAHAAAMAAHAHAAKLSAELRNKNNNEVDVDRKMMPGDPGESSAGEEEEGFSEEEPEPITAE